MSYKRFTYDDNGNLTDLEEDVTEGTEIYYHHSDHLGGSNIVTDDTGALVQELDYHPFGEVRANSQSASYDSTPKFTGHELDDATNLYYAQARYYDPLVARFISQDPLVRLKYSSLLSVPKRLNSYSYVLNNPIVLIDPTGLYDIKTRTVEDGDTLSGIASQINNFYGTKLAYNDLAKINGIKNPDKIVSGMIVSVGTIGKNGQIWMPAFDASDVTVRSWKNLTFEQQRIMHYQRNNYMGAVPENLSVVDKNTWTDPTNSGAHNLNEASGNVEIIGIGDLEGYQAVYDSDGNLVTNHENMGTYDYASPTTNISDHTLLGVTPWLFWGNSPQDSTNFFERASSIRHLF